MALELTDAHNRAAEPTGEKLFYANAYEDSDVLVEALPTGVETHYQLRSPSAPERFLLQSRREGDTFRLTSNGGAELVRDAKPVAAIAPAVAVNAQQQPLTVRFVVVDGALALDVEHRGRELAYPILVDPIIFSGSGGSGAGYGRLGAYHACSAGPCRRRRGGYRLGPQGGRRAAR